MVRINNQNKTFEELFGNDIHKRFRINMGVINQKLVEHRLDSANKKKTNYQKILLMERD